MSDYEKPFLRRYHNSKLSDLDFDNFTMEKLNEWVKKPKNFLLFSGSSGIGKTYFCAALYNYFQEQKKRITYMNEANFYREIREFMMKGFDYSYKAESLGDYEVIFILDDIGTAQMTDWQKEVLQLFIDRRYENMLPTIITTNVWTKDLGEVFLPKTKSRLLATENTIIELNTTDKRQLGM